MEIKPMKTATEAAIKVLVEKSQNDVDSGNAMRFAQAALNLTHVLDIVASIERSGVTPPRVGVSIDSRAT
jgi:hypothetical protein